MVGTILDVQEKYSSKIMSLNSKIVFIAIITSLLFGDRPYAIVLGIAQDGGAPHAGCENRVVLVY